MEAITHAKSMYVADPPTLAKAIGSLWGSTCVFFCHGFILPVLSLLEETLPRSAPSVSLTLPLNEPHNLGVEEDFWSSVTNVINVCRIYDDVVWGSGGAGDEEEEKEEGGGEGDNDTVSRLLSDAGVMTELTVARERR